MSVWDRFCVILFSFSSSDYLPGCILDSLCDCVFDALHMVTGICSVTCSYNANCFVSFSCR